MIIDFHTHMFPDKIAGRTLDYLSGIFGASPFADGTYTGLCNSMGKGAVDISIALPAVTKVSQVASINRFASAYTEGPVISFGGIHPECENYKEILKEIKNLGLKGIKLHPDYQGFFFDDPRAYPVYERCADLGLIVVIHAGSDPVSPGVIHADPQAIARVLDRFPRLILAGQTAGTMCFVILSANRCIWIQRFPLETSPLIPRGRSFVRMARIGSCLAATVHGTARPWMQSLSAHWA